MLTGRGLADYAISLIGSPYMYGVNGLVVTEALIQSKANQYPNMYTAGYIAKCRLLIGKTAYDCSSITDLYCNKDKSANGWLSYCQEKGAISTMPDIVGVIVHKDGHMGVYVGGGCAVEARGIDYGVVKTKVADRPWTSWGKIPDLEYGEEGEIMLQKGDKGLAVTYWQKSLLKWDASALPQWGADSDFGGETETWTNKFKASVGLPQDGIVDAITYGHMANALISMITGISQNDLDEVARRLASAMSLLTASDEALQQEQDKVLGLTSELSGKEAKISELQTYKDTAESAKSAIRWLIT